MVLFRQPYLVNIFGLDHKAVHRKYELDQEIEKAEKERDLRRAEVQLDQQDRNELATRVEIWRDEIAELSDRLDGFDFSQEERRISKRVVDQIERRIADINNALYNFDADISQIERSISSGFKFNLKQVKRVFEESKVTLPEAVVHRRGLRRALHGPLQREDLELRPHHDGE